MCAFVMLSYECDDLADGQEILKSVSAPRDALLSLEVRDDPDPAQVEEVGTILGVWQRRAIFPHTKDADYRPTRMYARDGKRGDEP